jgi:hypothetical protein
MKNVRVVTVGAVCAVLLTVAFVIGIAFMASSGVQTLIPETGEEGLEWIADVQDASDLFFVGPWLVVIGGLLGVVAILGFYDALRAAGPVLIVAPVVGAVGLTLVTFSHAVPISMAYELAPGYTEASGATQASLAVTADTLASICLLTNYVGDALLWGVMVPLYAFAILRTSVVARWIGWLGLVVAVFAGWLGLLSPVSSIVEGLSAIGFLGFFVFMASFGIALLLRGRSAEGYAPALGA